MTFYKTKKSLQTRQNQTKFNYLTELSAQMQLKFYKTELINFYSNREKLRQRTHKHYEQ